MQNLSIKLKTLLLFILSVAAVASVSLAITVYQSNELGEIQAKDGGALILENNKEALKAYTLMAEKAISAFYELTLEQILVKKSKKMRLYLKK